MKGLQITNVGTIVCVTLILIMIGLMGKLLIFGYYFKERIKEDVGFNVFVEESVQKKEADRLMKRIQKRPEVKAQKFINKDQALKTFIEDGNEDPTLILGYNPLPASIHILLVDSFVNRDHLNSFENYLKTIPSVTEVKYAEDFVDKVNDNIKRITWAMTGVLALLFFISFILIDNTIKLNMLNNRFTIKTMQYAGASHFSIAFPYLKTGVFQGIFSGILAIVIIVSINQYIGFFFKEFINLSNIKWEMTLYMVLVVIGAFLTFFSTINSVYKYLKTSVSKLYK